MLSRQSDALGITHSSAFVSNNTDEGAIPEVSHFTVFEHSNTGLEINFFVQEPAGD